MNRHVRQCSLAVLISLLIFSGCSATRDIPSPLRSTDRFRQEIDRLLADSLFSPVVSTVKIVSLRSSEVLYERNSQLLMRPASNMKLLTSATALMRLGKEFRFTTRVSYDGTVVDSVLHGSLYIKGSGDPDLSSAALAGLCREIGRKGITRIDGDIVGDASYFDGERWGVGWMWDDEPSGYAAFNSALSINRNCVDVRVEPSDSIGGRARVTIIPATQYVTVDNTALTGDSAIRSTIEVSRKFFERTNTITVTGSLPFGARAKTESITVLRPELYFLTLTKEELERQHIRVTGTARLGVVPPAAREIAQHQQPIDSMVVYLNKVSDNLSAENSLKTVSAEVLGGGGSTRHGVSLVKQTLAGFGIDSLSFLMVDGSGVSHYNLLTSEIYIKLLQAMHEQKPMFDLYYASLPIAGVDGSLSDRMRGTAAQNNLHAKTGTISGVTTLAGYVTTADGEMLAFSMMMQNFIGSTEPFRRAQDAIGALMANFKR